MGKRLVLVGAGHAHLTTISAIRSLVKRGHTVTVIAPSDHHYYSGMAPGMLSGTYRPQEIRFNVYKLTTSRGGQFIKGKVTRINPAQQEVLLEGGQRVHYDVVSFNVGSVIPSGKMELGDGSVFPVKPIERIVEGRTAILDMWDGHDSGKPLELVVVGGGPAGVEMAGALWRLSRDNRIQSRTTLLTGSELLGLFPRRLQAKVRRSLGKRGIQIREGSRVTSIGAHRVTLEDGSTIPADITLLATGIIPSRLFAESGLPAAVDGGLLVNNYLQSVEYPQIFGGGDCVTLQEGPLARVGVYAVRENPVLLTNLAAALEEKPLQRFDPGSSEFLLILNMGDGTAVFRKGEWIFKGKPAFWIKDFIDRRFMRKFQLSGELEEEL
ncbi:MAG: FAD-dependent oxidoreductase [bacterium]|nr:FAD-dependent oxidoreductase [bacterium]MDT8366360.1 FAD-dependent oxidoreductase [bacterium]